MSKRASYRERGRFSAALVRGAGLLLFIWLSLSTTFAARQNPNQADKAKAAAFRNSAPAEPPVRAAPQPRLVVQTGHASGVFAAAFSGDGRFALTGGGDETARLWEVATGREIRVFEGHTESVGAVAFVGDTAVLTASGDNTARLWDLRTGEVIRALKGHMDVVGAAAVSPDGRFVLTGSLDGTARLWETQTGREVRRFPHSKPVMAVAFSPDGNTLLTGASDGLARRWDIASGQALRVYPKQEGALYSVAFSPDGRQVAVGGENLNSKMGKGFLRLWETETGRELTKFRGHEEAVNSVRFTPDGLSLVVGSGDGTACFWDVKTGEEQRRFRPKENNPVHTAVLSPDGQILLTGTSKQTDGDVGMEGARLWDTRTGEEIHSLNGDVARVVQAVFSQDEKRIHVEEVGGKGIKYTWDTDTGREFRTVPVSPPAIDNEEYVRPSALSPDRTLRAVENESGSVEDPNGSVILLKNARTGKVIRRLAGTGFNVLNVAFSPNGRYLLATYYHGCGRVWEVATGRRILTFDDWGLADAAAFSPDSRAALIGNESGEVKLWSLEAGKVERVFVGHRQHVYSVAYSPKDGRFVLTGCVDGTTRVWEAATGRELCRLVSFHSGIWVATTPDGRFDTNNLDHIEGMHWVFPDEPLTPLPLEVFLRQYYEPRLLTRILAGERLAPVPALLSLNRVQPEIHIEQITPEGDGKVTVTVKVASVIHKMLRDGKPTPVPSGVFDLRLFREGQAVGYAPATDGAVPLDREGTARVTFVHIALPLNSGKKELLFSAYAFNTDRVKSATDSKVYTLPSAVGKTRGRAYVICIGVNAYEDPAFNLRFAVNDARLFAATLPARLMTTGQYTEIIPLVLASEEMSHSGEGAATKANLRAVLERLAGKQPDLSGVPGAQRLRTAAPDDLILLCFSGHGYAARSGAFYLLPQDIGPPTVPAQGKVSELLSPTFLARCVSSEELSAWLRDVDAGEMVFIVDACQSAASIEGKDFKPGPLGSRGLGQLAYDKGMRVLAASQANDFAIESNRLQHGLLSYTLVQEGLLTLRAASGKGLTLGEWLRFGAKRVPELYEAVLRGDPLPDSSGKGIQAVGAGAHKSRLLQQPALFDFRRSAADIPLWQLDRLVP